MNKRESTYLRVAFDAERFRRDGHRVVDRLADYLASALERRSDALLPWVEPSHQLATLRGFQEGPAASESLEAVLDDVLRATLRLHDPRVMGHQDAVPLPAAALGSLISSLLNNDPSIYETGPGAVAIEARVLEWMIAEIGYPASAGGVLTSGGSLGNLTALLAARQVKGNCERDGRRGNGNHGPCVLTSEQAHYSISRAAQVMGWGDGGCVAVPTDERYRMRVDALPAALARARQEGRHPIAVVATAGTTATGALDPLVEIADFCQLHDLWLHVDGAHGASAVLSPRHRAAVAGIERADSVIWDGHKLMLMPSALTAVLFHNGRHAYEVFQQRASCLYGDEPDKEWYNPGNRTVECTKPALATRLYLTLRLHGIGLFRDYVARSFDLARLFAEMIEAEGHFELAAPPECNIVCFRYNRGAEAELDLLQSRLRQRLVEAGTQYLTRVELAGRAWLRCVLMHPLTDEGDLAQLLAAIRSTAATLGGATRAR